MPDLNTDITDQSKHLKQIYHTLTCPYKLDTSAGRSTKARGLPHAVPVYDPRDMLAWLCQKHRSCRPDWTSLCSGCHRWEMKLIVRPCGETRWPHASSPRIFTGRSSKNRLPFWSWLAAMARTPTPFMDPAVRRWYTLQHSCWMVQGSSLWPLWVDALDLCCLCDLMMMMMMI